MLPVRGVLLACALSLSALGCSSGTSTSTDAGPTAETELNEVANMLRDYVSEHNRTPTKVADLALYESIYQVGYQAVKSGKVVVLWGGRVVGEGQTGQGGDRIVAHQQQVPTEGGLVLLENGAVKRMTADEFQAAPKAGKK